MCGVVGLLELGGEARRYEAELVRATDRIAHRGPDDEGRFFDGPVGLGFRRLSILDLSPLGHQPMTSADGRWTVAYNGEVYNFLELRKELESRGARFRSDCDTEVLLESIATFGLGCLERMNGMWGLLAWDARERILHAVRDPWGIKPLFLARDGNRILLASEIKALREFGLDLSRVDAAAARNFIARGMLDSDERTLFEGVERLGPGIIHSFHADGTERSEVYGDGTAGVEVPAGADETEWSEAFREAFIDSVRIRLRADVDVGTSLSGGLDSTAITGVTSQLLAGDRVSACRYGFTAHFPDFDESRYIRPLVEERDLRWHVTSADDDLLDEKTRRFFTAHDEPVHSLAPLAGFLVMELAARENVRVLLNGQGADELLAGYPSTQRYYLRTLVREGDVAYAVREAFRETSSASEGLKLLGASVAGFVPFAGKLAARNRRDRLLAGELATAPLEPLESAGDLAKVRELSVFREPLPLYLRIEDTNSSAFSLEARLPFLDPRLVAFARRAPTRLLRKGGLNKFLLRSILPGLVPDVIWKRRDKMGFPVPHARWLRGPLRDFFVETLDSERLARRGWYDTTRLVAARDGFLDETTGLDPELMRVFLLEAWAGNAFGA